MGEVKYVVPEGMLKAAQSSALGGEFPIMEFIRRGVEAAIRWQSENPPVMSRGQQVEVLKEADGIKGSVSDIATSWIRRMYRAPELVVPEEIKDLLRQDGSVTYGVSEHNTAVLMAYHRGCNSKKG